MCFNVYVAWLSIGSILKSRDFKNSNVRRPWNWEGNKNDLAQLEPVHSWRIIISKFYLRDFARLNFGNEIFSTSFHSICQQTCIILFLVYLTNIDTDQKWVFASSFDFSFLGLLVRSSKIQSYQWDRQLILMYEEDSRTELKQSLTHKSCSKIDGLCDINWRVRLYFFQILLFFINPDVAPFASGPFSVRRSLSFKLYFTFTSVLQYSSLSPSELGTEIC